MRDVDAKFEPHGPVLEAARTIATNQGLPQSWLNDHATVFLARQEDRGGPRVFDHPYLRVFPDDPLAEHKQLRIQDRLERSGFGR